MRTIIQIEGVEEKVSKEGTTYWRTYAVLDDGTEAVGFGKDFDLDMQVECFFHKGIIKMQKRKG